MTVKQKMVKIMGGYLAARAQERPRGPENGIAFVVSKNWRVELPWWLYLPPGMLRTDNRKFYRLLAKCGLPDAADTFRMAWQRYREFLSRPRGAQ